MSDYLIHSQLIVNPKVDVAGKEIALIGVGRMGTGIGLSLLRHGARVLIKGNSDRTGLDQLIKLGAKEFRCCAELSQVSVVILSLPSSMEVESVCNNEAGLFYSLAPGSVVIDCSTSRPSSTEFLSACAKQRGIYFVDAPVTRSPEHAVLGQLNALVGASDDIFPLVMSIVAAFCQGIIHAGGVGKGHQLKLIYNGMTMGIAAVVAETCQLAQHAHIDLSLIRDVVNQGSTNSGIFQKFVTFLLQEDLNVLSISISNASKDLRYALEVSQQEEIELPTLAAASIKLQSVVSQGRGDLTLPNLALL